MKLKLLILPFVVSVLFFCNNFSGYSQTVSTDPKAIAFLEGFYKNYISTYLSGIGPTNQKKIDELKSKYCSKRLIEHILELQKTNELDSDPFLHSQDYNDAWTKSLKITKAKKGLNIYNASYIQAAENRVIIIRLSVIRKGSTYRIDGVW